MPLTAAALKAVAVVAEGEPTELVLARGSRVATAVMVRRRQGGFLLAVPAGAFEEEVLVEGMDADRKQAVGPSILMAVPPMGEEGEPLEFEPPLAVLVVDCSSIVGRQLHRKADWEEEVPLLWRADAAGAEGEDEDDEPFDIWTPHWPTLLSIADEALEGLKGKSERSDAYLSCVELPLTGASAKAKAVGRSKGKETHAAAGSGESQSELLATLKGIQNSLGQLSERVGALEGGGGARPPMPGGGPSSADSMQTAKDLAGRPPKTAHGGRGRNAATFTASAKGRPLTAPGGEEEEEEEMTPGGCGSGEVADETQLFRQMSMMFMKKSIEEMKGGKRKKKRLPGLDEGSESGEDEGAELTKLMGAKGSLLGETLRNSQHKNPAPYSSKIEENMVKALEDQTLDARSAMRYITKVVPMGSQKMLGWPLVMLARIHGAHVDGKPELARFLTLATLMAIEQYCLDENWETAWRMTGVEPPPFADWSRQDVAAMRRAFPKSRLAEKTWVAAMVAEIRDDDFLIKRRGKGGGKKNNKDEE